MSDTRERIRALEVFYDQGQHRLIDCFRSHKAQIERQDQRIAAVEATLSKHAETVADTLALEGRVRAIETRWERFRSSGQYLAAAVVLGLVATGRMTVDQAHALIDLGLRLLLPGFVPPGSSG